MSLQMVKSVGVGRFLNWVSVDARGAAGGLLLFGITESWRIWRLKARAKRKILGGAWSHPWPLDDPWCLGGDFNSVRFLEKRRNTHSLTAEMRRFSKVIGELGLRDSPLTGGLFTWIGVLNSQVASSPIVLEAGEIKALKKDLKIWNKEVVGNVSSNRVEAFSCLQCWEAKENDNPLTLGDMEAKNLAIENYKKWALLEETSWRQKSREICPSSQNLGIGGLVSMALISRSWEKWPAAWKLCSLRKKSLQPLAAAGSLQGVLPPWDLLEKLKLHVLLAHSQKGGGEDIRDFRPITLVGSVYKLLAKVLANRLKSMMGEVSGGKLDVANEGRAVILKDNKPGLLLKMDIEKAFDHVNWDFLMESGRKRKRGLIVSHLLFAYDTLIFCDAEADQLQYLSWTFMWFEAISGLKVNLSKTEAFPMGEGIPMEILASVLGCKIWSFPTTWVSLLEPPTNPPGCRMQWKKDSGKCCLSEKGNTSPKIQRDFLWGGGALENKPHLWLWRFANENESLWKQIISSKYDLQDGGWCSKGVRDRYGVGVWKAIRNEAFPTLFNLSVNKESWVAEAWEEDRVGVAGGLVLIDTLMNWEVGEVESLLGKLLPMTIRRGVDDSLWWKENKNETFLVKSFYSSLSRGIKPPFRPELFGRLGSQLELAFLVEEAAWSKMLTTDRLKRFGQNVMAFDFLPFWGAMGDALLCEKEPPGLAWFSSWFPSKETNSHKNLRISYRVVRNDSALLLAKGE
ncbi:hypothetical protein CK203_092415 [Vitis vinifera]|uniref:Reverse transcriptase domain-containing protein n=1 Tax=Vitis vinifera TaxID=29760 RepID=A0A438F0R9_VITVI|nr:hypothetical protein CK203_092415 [Vitis vinifera]